MAFSVDGIKKILVQHPLFDYCVKVAFSMKTGKFKCGLFGVFILFQPNALASNAHGTRITIWIYSHNVPTCAADLGCCPPKSTLLIPKPFCPPYQIMIWPPAACCKYSGKYTSYILFTVCVCVFMKSV